MKYLLSYLSILLLLTGCSTLNDDGKKDAIMEKVRFDLNQLDKDGLYGSGDGKRALSYEFCIPAIRHISREVMNIDSSATVYQSSPGAIGCSDQQYLVIGNTSQADYRATLERLSRLAYITQIVETHFE